MPKLTVPVPLSAVETVTDVLHGVSVADPYRWLENQRSSATRGWIAAQTHYARNYLDAIPARKEIRARVREFLEVETYDSILSAGERHFFRKRTPHEEQACIYMRQGRHGKDELLVDPASRGTGPFTSVKPLRISPNARFLLYEIKQGGERAGVFEILDVETHEVLSDRLPYGHLRSFWFASDSDGFFYAHQPVGGNGSPLAARHHVLGSTDPGRVLFESTESKGARMYLASDGNRLGVLLYRFVPKRTTEFHFSQYPLSGNPFSPLVTGLDCSLGPVLWKNRILAITDQGAPNLRIVEIPSSPATPDDWKVIIAETDARIRHWTICGDSILVLYVRGTRTLVQIFDERGQHVGEVPFPDRPTVRWIPAVPGADEAFFEAESFTVPPVIYRYRPEQRTPEPWMEVRLRGGSESFVSREFSYASTDGTSIPITLVGRPEVMADGSHPAIMTSYGGFAAPMTPQFSVLVTCLLEAGCLFALPHIRGGSEFGASWHEAARARRRQQAFDDFLAAAEWLISTGRTAPSRLAIFGGSHSGLLAGVAFTQRPELFKAAMCIAPLLDMLRYHLFDQAYLWKDELGTAEDPADFSALLRYSPYHNVREDKDYPALLLVAGDADGNCNALHARKMTARVQAATASDNPILLDYSMHRGHSAVLPLSMRIDALTDRLAFVCDQLGLSMKGTTLK